MPDNEIKIRPALPADAVEIWRLLHTDHHIWGLEKVRQEIGGMYVLSHREKLLGVLRGSFGDRRGALEWVSIHPMYPENTLRTAMVSALCGVLCRQPLNEIPR
jgi:hypothetical protein